MCCTFINIQSQNEQTDLVRKALKNFDIDQDIIEKQIKHKDMLHQNVYADFILKINKVKNYRLHRTRAEGTNKYIIPKDAIEEYVGLFDRLRSTNKNATVQCLYIDQVLGGEPYLIMSEFDLDSLDLSKVNIYDFRQNAASNFMVPCEDTAMAYFQYLVFKIYGEQFGLYWHALYKKKEILLLYPSLLNTFVEYSIANKQLNKKALENGLVPIVSMDDDNCYITLFEENHENIVQITYLIKRRAPWEISRKDENIMIHKENLIVY